MQKFGHFSENGGLPVTLEPVSQLQGSDIGMFLWAIIWGEDFYGKGR